MTTMTFLIKLFLTALICVISGVIVLLVALDRELRWVKNIGLVITGISGEKA